MSTKLDKWIEERFSQRRWSDPLTEAINEYRASRQWVEGPPPEGCDAAWVTVGSSGALKAIRSWQNSNYWYATEYGSLITTYIIRHCPIPDAPPLPNPDIPDEVRKHGDGWYWRDGQVVKVKGQEIWFCGCTSPLHVKNDDCKWTHIPEPKVGEGCV